MQDLNSPLGLDRKPQQRGGLRSRVVRIFVPAGAVVAVLGVASWITFSNGQIFRKPEVSKPADQVALQTDNSATQAVARDKPKDGNTPLPGSAGARTENPNGPAIIKVTPDMPTITSGGLSSNVIVVNNMQKPGQDPRMAHVPVPELIEKSASGPLPVRGADGQRPLDAYASGWSGTRGARIALVIGGLGLSQTGTQQAIKRLPGDVTLAFAPQGNSLQRWMQAARQDGHEILMQLPLEPFDYPRINPGPNTLTVDAGAAKNMGSLLWALGRTTNYTGVINYMGARFTADADALRPVIQEIGRRGLLYLDDGTSARSQADALSAAEATPFAAADVLIDSVQERGAILDKLGDLERIARAKGTAVGTGSAFDITVDTVAAWANEAKSRGIEIVPVSALVRDPEKN